MFRVTRYPMISKTESGWVGYRKKYRVAGRVRVPAGHCIGTIFGECSNYKSGLRILIWPLEVPFFLVTFGQKCPFSDQKKWHFEWPNQNSKTTFIVQTFPKNGPYGFDLVNLSLLGPILAKFQFCWFSGLFWPFFPCKWGQTRKSFPERQFLVYNAEIFFVNSYNPWAWVVKRTKLNSKKV